MVEAFQTPLVKVPTEVSELETTPEPSPVLLRTLVPSMRKEKPAASSMFWLDVQLSVASYQRKVLSVPALRTMPPPFAPASVGEAVAPSSRVRSSTLTVVLLIVVVVPLTVRLPRI